MKSPAGDGTTSHSKCVEQGSPPKANRPSWIQPISEERFQMRDLGKRSGEAELVANGEDLGRVHFSASFIEDSLGRSGWGVIEGDAGALFKAFTASSNQLRFDDGASAGIVITNPGQGKGTFKTSGPWPGV